ncbi:hypothetical protein B0O99DRAFT_95648 [Bisporella sp. PMI_857]|nr:hypothetical protein B0O99DRAFT_95648 [Bisporella sp. PMI_857]
MLEGSILRDEKSDDVEVVKECLCFGIEDEGFEEALVSVVGRGCGRRRTKLVRLKGCNFPGAIRRLATRLAVYGIYEEFTHILALFYVTSSSNGEDIAKRACLSSARQVKARIYILMLSKQRKDLLNIVGLTLILVAARDFMGTMKSQTISEWSHHALSHCCAMKQPISPSRMYDIFPQSLILR